MGQDSRLLLSADWLVLGKTSAGEWNEGELVALSVELDDLLFVSEVPV